MVKHAETFSVSCRSSFTRVTQFEAAVPHDLADVLWAQPESLIELGEPLRVNGVRQTVRLTWAGQQYVLKHYVERSRRHALKRAVQSSRARSTWNVMHAMADAGIATPRPLALVENRLGPLRRDSFILYPYLEGRTLRACFAEHGFASQSEFEPIWRQLGDLWKRLKQVRASLADTNVGNFIVCPAGRVWVIDLDNARFHRFSFTASHYQQRGWKQLLRSTAKCADKATPELASNLNRPAACLALLSNAE